MRDQMQTAPQGELATSHRSIFLNVVWILAVILTSLASLGFAADVEIDSDGAWGKAANGIRCRVTAIATETDDELAVPPKSNQEFARGDRTAFLVELENVSKEPITLLGVRYGKQFGESSGKLNAAHFASYLFDFKFTDLDGKTISRPKRQHIESGVDISGASTHQIAPGERLSIVLRPGQLRDPMNHVLQKGSYRLAIHYLGITESQRAFIAKHWPNSEQVNAWGGTVASPPVTFTIAESAPETTEESLDWGDEVKGLRAAVEFQPRGERVKPVPADGAANANTPLHEPIVPLNTVLETTLHVKNVSEDPIQFVSETWRQDDPIEFTTEENQTVQVAGTWYSGSPLMVRWTLMPGETAALRATSIAVAASKDALEDFDHPIGRSLIAKPGRYFGVVTIRLGSIRSQNAEGKQIFPTADDWQGELNTGSGRVTIRERTEADDDELRKLLFSSEIVFESKDGSPIGAGEYSLRETSSRRKPLTGSFADGRIAIENCRPKSLSLYVRADGYEEQHFHGLMMKKDQPTLLQLSPAKSSRFRLVTGEDKQPVVGARVRYFNRTAALASSGPYPIDGLKGDVWSVSDNDGIVTLKSLRMIDPTRDSLGVDQYHFYVESPNLAPVFVGPVEAGKDLGDVVVGDYIEVRGEIIGTPAQIAQFAAEWDQPYQQVSDNPDAAWNYAESKPLELIPQPKGVAEQGKAVQSRKFVLRNLRPGKLRIIANFNPAKNRQISHSYTRRDPKPGDHLFEFELTESRDDLVVRADDEFLVKGESDK